MIRPELRPMSASELLDRTFHLYRNNFVLFAGIAALAPALGLAAELLAIALGAPLDFASFRSGSTHTNRDALRLLLQVMILFLIQLVAGQWSYGATVYEVSRVHLSKPASIREAYSIMRSYWARLLGISLLIGARIAGIAIIFAIVSMFPLAGLVALPFAVWWGVYVYARYSLAGAACVLEGAHVGDSMERSRFLAVNGTWRIFLILLLTWVLDSAFTYALRVPAEILMRMHHGPAGIMVVVTRHLGTFLSQTLATPIGTIALTLVYYDQRIRKEAFDLEVMMQGLKQADARRTAATAPL